MKSKTRLDSAVFQLTPTRTRCDLYIIANGKKEKISSGLVDPFIAHLKAAQDQIAEGGYSVLLAPEAHSNATWFTKGTVESFVRFVSTPEILERVVTIESEIIQIEEAISIQGNNDISIKDQYVMPVPSNEVKNPARDVDGEEMAIVLYKRGAHELTDSSAKERNSKVQLIDILETRKEVLKKEQGMAFARAVAAGFDIEHVANLLSFAECFGASRLMNGCLGFMDLWRKKHESGQWVEIETEEAMSNSSTSGIVMTNEPSIAARGSDVISETAGSNTSATGGEQQYHGGQRPWVMHSSPQGGIPVYHVPYYQHYPGFYPPPPPPFPSFIEDPCHFQKRQCMDNNNIYNNTESEAADKKKAGRVVIHNINFKIHTSSEDADDHTQQKEKRNLETPKRKGNHKDLKSETLSGKETDGGGHWDAFQTCLLKSAAESDMFAMEKDRRQKTMADYDPLLAHAKHNDDTIGLKMLETNSKKTPTVVKYEPDALSLMPERDVENSRYDPAINYEVQLAAAAASQDKKGSKRATARKHQLSKPNQGVVNKGRPSKMNNIYNNKKTLEDARARADRLRSYKADLQKMKKEQQDAEQKRLEALKIERQKRISARKQLPASSKFTDSEPNSSSPLQRSKIRPTSINNSETASKLVDRMTRSLSNRKNEMSSVTTTSIARIRRLSEPKKINTPHNTKLRSAEPVSKPKLSAETKKISAASDQRTAAELKVTSSSNPISSKVGVMLKETTSQVAEVNSNNRVNPIVDKTVVLEHKKQPSSTTKEFDSNLRTGMNTNEVPLPDKSVHPQKHTTTSSKVRVDEGGKKFEAPYACVSSFEDQSTRNSNYAKAPRHRQPKFGGNGTDKAYVFDNLKKIPESNGGFRRLLKLGKKSHTSTPSVPDAHPKVATLKSLISEDATPARKPSRRLFSFKLGGEKKV